VSTKTYEDTVRRFDFAFAVFGALRKHVQEKVNVSERER